MTTRKNHDDIQCFVFLSIVYVIVIFLFLYFNNWKIDAVNWKAIALFTSGELLFVALSFLGTHGGFFTDTVTINEEGIIFGLKQGIISYKWHELEKVVYHCSTGGRTFFVYGWKRPTRGSIQFSCNKEFADYFFQVYPNIQK